MLIRLNVNGESREADVWPGTSLLSMLRDHLGLVGSKNACEQGECGSCSLWLDGELVCACLVLAAQAGGRDVRTVESLAPGDRLHPVQDAFVEAGAVQCGFCTPRGDRHGPAGLAMTALVLNRHEQTFDPLLRRRRHDGRRWDRTAGRVDPG